MKYYIIAGEASGDLHGANLMKELKLTDTNSQFRFWGGDKMQAQGGKQVKHYRDLAFMGFLEVVLNLRTILRNISFCKADIANWQPDVVVLIDYPGFNLRIAKHLKRKGVKVFYYISPQIWAWKESRVNTIKQCVDRMFVILPFEKSFYEKHNYAVDFVGHPLLDALNDDIASHCFRIDNQLTEKPIVALLPGSRKQEIAKILAEMAKVAALFPDKQFVVAGLKHIGEPYYNQIIAEYPVKLVINQTYPLLSHAEAALVTSGTATLETALFKVPQVVCYKGSWLSYQIGKRLVKVKYISLVNLVMDKAIVQELIQNQLNTNSLTSSLSYILNKESRNSILYDYQQLTVALGGAGASRRTAELMVKYLR